MLNYTQDTINKIGHTIIYLAERIQPLSKTKLLKLLYLLEEFSVKKYHTPFLDLKFEVWQAGPVAKDIFVDLSQEEPILLRNFIKTKYRNSKTGTGTFIEPISEFNDDEFSDNEILLLEKVVNEFKNASAAELVKFTHKRNSLWYKIAKKHDLLESFNNGTLTSSDYSIDFSEVLLGNDFGLEVYQDKREFNEFVKALKN